MKAKNNKSDTLANSEIRTRASSSPSAVLNRYVFCCKLFVVIDLRLEEMIRKTTHFLSLQSPVGLVLRRGCKEINSFFLFNNQ
jgi:hypothetical protein